MKMTKNHNPLIDKINKEKARDSSLKKEIQHILMRY